MKLEELGQREGKQRIVQELVPGKQITLAHIIANPDGELYEKLGLDPRVELSRAAIGIMTVSPAETAIIMADIAVKSSGVALGFVDRFSGSLIVTGTVSEVEAASAPSFPMWRRSWGIRSAGSPGHEAGRRRRPPRKRAGREARMKKIILIGRSGAGKTTLTQALKGEEIKYHKTQYVNHFESIIDTPGEYAQTHELGYALALYSYEADVVGLLLSAEEPFSLYPPNITCMVNREVVGIITHVDSPKGDPERRNGGCGCRDAGRSSASIRRRGKGCPISWIISARTRTKKPLRRTALRKNRCLMKENSKNNIFSVK